VDTYVEPSMTTVAGQVKAAKFVIVVEGKYSLTSDSAPRMRFAKLSLSDPVVLEASELEVLVTEAVVGEPEAMLVDAFQFMECANTIRWTRDKTKMSAILLVV